MQEALHPTPVVRLRRAHRPGRDIQRGPLADERWRFLFYPAIKQLTLDVASLVFMGHEPDTNNDLVAEINRAFHGQPGRGRVHPLSRPAVQVVAAACVVANSWTA